MLSCFYFHLFCAIILICAYWKDAAGAVVRALPTALTVHAPLGVTQDVLQAVRKRETKRFQERGKIQSQSIMS